MHPRARAALDRFIYDQAVARHMVTAAPEAAWSRPVVGCGGTVGQVLSRFAAENAAASAALRGLAEGGSLPAELPAEACADAGEPARDETLQRLDASLRDLFAAFHAVPDDRWQPAALEQVDRWSRHVFRCGFALAEALPEVELDSIVLRWLTRFFPENDAERDLRARYVERVRAAARREEGATG